MQISNGRLAYGQFVNAEFKLLLGNVGGNGMTCTKRVQYRSTMLHSIFTIFRREFRMV